jgi:hypothetical protein
MRQDRRRNVPSWRAGDPRALRPGHLLLASVLLGALLLEVWQTASVKSFSVRLDEASRALQQSSAELEYTRAELERGSTRAELGPLAAELGLRPVDPAQIVALPEGYLADAGERPSPGTSSPLLAFAGRALHSLVPDAMARGRNVN